VGAEEREIIEEMADMMRLAGGIGLAAPQVGIDRQLIIVDIGQGLVALFNPRILKRSGSAVMEEGCLSLPGVHVKVKRARSVTVTGLNEHNEIVKLSATDLMARALQHEMDHLRGRVILDYAHLIDRIRFRRKLRAFVREGNARGL
jgi:peptide deformylase